MGRKRCRGFSGMVGTTSWSRRRWGWRGAIVLHNTTATTLPPPLPSPILYLPAPRTAHTHRRPPCGHTAMQQEEPWDPGTFPPKNPLPYKATAHTVVACCRLVRLSKCIGGAGRGAVGAPSMSSKDYTLCQCPSSWRVPVMTCFEAALPVSSIFARHSTVTRRCARHALRSFLHLPITILHWLCLIPPPPFLVHLLVPRRSFRLLTAGTAASYTAV